MTNKEKYIGQVLNGFQEKRGKASVYCFSKEIIPELVYNIINRFTNKYKGKSIFIAVDGFATRSTIMKYLSDNNISVDKGYNIKVLSRNYIASYYSYNYDLILTIGLNGNDTEDIENIEKMNKTSKFMLTILTANIMDNNFITKVRSILPDIVTINPVKGVKSANIYSPVKEMRYGVELNAKVREIYDKYTEFINTTITIFGSLENIDKCRIGDITNNISANKFRYDFAKENGWNEQLNTNIDFMKQIDDLYNPNALEDRANTFYNITKLRRDIVSDTIDKLETIKNICENNKDKRILILSKRGEFAHTIAEYINTTTTDIKCGEYHDCIPETTLNDVNGNIIFYKSGTKKGTPRIFGAQYLSNFYETQFNQGIIKCLSAKFASNEKLKIACDIVILTTSLYNNIIDVKSRFTDIDFIDIPTKVYLVYANNTIEQEKLNKAKPIRNVKIINMTENNFIGYDENSGDIIL